MMFYNYLKILYTALLLTLTLTSQALRPTMLVLQSDSCSDVSASHLHKRVRRCQEIDRLKANAKSVGFSCLALTVSYVYLVKLSRAGPTRRRCFSFFFSADCIDNTPALPFPPLKAFCSSRVSAVPAGSAHL